MKDNKEKINQLKKMKEKGKMRLKRDKREKDGMTNRNSN